MAVVLPFSPVPSNSAPLSLSLSNSLGLNVESFSLPFDPFGRPAAFFFDFPSPFTPNNGCTSERQAGGRGKRVKKSKTERQTNEGQRYRNLINFNVISVVDHHQIIKYRNKKNTNLSKKKNRERDDLTITWDAL